MNGIILGQSTKMAEALEGVCDTVYLVIDNHTKCSRIFKEINNYPLINTDTSMTTIKGIIPRTIELIKWVKMYNLHVIFSQTKYDMIAAKAASFFLRKRRVILLGTSHNSYAWLNDSAVKKMSFLIKLTNDCYISLASFVYNKLKRNGLEDDKLLLLPNTIEFAEWKVKTDYSLKTRIRMVYVAYLYPGKRQHILVEIIEQLSNQYEIEVDCYGDLKDVTYVKYIKKLISEKGLEGKINLKGRIENSELRNLLLNYDIYICPTLMEMSPVNILEAKAAGLPIVTSNVGGIPDMLTDGIDGLFFEVDNIDDACSKIQRLLENQHLRESLGKEARYRVSKVYTAKEAGERLKEKIFSLTKC